MHAARSLTPVMQLSGFECVALVERAPSLHTATAHDCWLGHAQTDSAVMWHRHCSLSLIS